MRRHRAPTPPLAALALIGLVAGPAGLHAQGTSLQYAEVTRVEAPGVIGAMLARSADGEETRAVHVLEGRLRTDDGSTSMIFDAGEREWIILEHESRTYLRFSLDDLGQLTAETLEAMREHRTELGQAPTDTEAERHAARAEMEEAERTMEVSFEHIATGERERIGEYQAERHHIIVRMEEAEGIQGAEEVEGGSLVILLDLWASEELARQHPLHQPDNPFHRALMEDPAFRDLAEEIEASFRSGGAEGDLAAYAMVDPRVGAAMGEAFASLSEIEGIPVRTATVVAVLPPAVELDTELLVAWEPETMGDQIRGEASEAARDAAREAARGAVRDLTRGIFARDRGEDPEPEIAEEDLIIRPLFRVTTEVTQVRSGPAPSPDLFRIPDGYTEMTTATGPAGAGTPRR